MRSLEEVFAGCRQERRAAFIPYLTGGDPDLPTSRDLFAALAENGADILEVGVPFSDPIADGPVNQRSTARALQAGTTLSGILDLVAWHRGRSPVPVVLFSYFNPLFVRGLERFADQAADSGVDGVLCVDLPPSEAAEEFIPVLQERQIDTVFLLAPTSTRNRIREVAAAATGFVYYVSRTGVTGVQEHLTRALKREVKRLRRRLRQPLAVGFGISTPEHVETVGGFADGVVVGSALVRVVDEHREHRELAAMLGAEARRLSDPLRHGGRAGR